MINDDQRIRELNDAHGRGIVAELFRDSPPRPRDSAGRMGYRTLSRGMYRDQYGHGMRYAHDLVEWSEMMEAWADG